MTQSIDLYTRTERINADKGYRYGEEEPYPVSDSIFDFDGTLGDVPQLLSSLYKWARREYGRCVSKVYVDGKDGKAHQVGWTFVKRERYDDARTNKDTYLAETWFTVDQRINGQWLHFQFDRPDRFIGC